MAFVLKQIDILLCWDQSVRSPLCLCHVNRKVMKETVSCCPPQGWGQTPWMGQYGGALKSWGHILLRNYHPSIRHQETLVLMPQPQDSAVCVLEKPTAIKQLFWVHVAWTDCECWWQKNPRERGWNRGFQCWWRLNSLRMALYINFRNSGLALKSDTWCLNCR